MSWRIDRWAGATAASPLLVLALATSAALAQPSPQPPFRIWPEKTVRFIIPLRPAAVRTCRAPRRRTAERTLGPARRGGEPPGRGRHSAVSSFLSARDNHTFLLSFAGVITFNALLHERLPLIQPPIWCRSHP
jgi:hypothetical protein